MSALPAWQPHLEVWLLVGGVLALGIYAAWVIGPKVVPAGQPVVTRQQGFWFAFGIVTLWVSSTWPIHDVAEQQLYAVHMVQHFALTMLVPPMFLLATPRWLAGLLVTQGGNAWMWLRRVANPVVAAVIFNSVVVLSHWTFVVNTSVTNGPFHFGMHLLVVTSALIMWIPVCGPWPELRMSSIPATCIYLFVQSIIPTVPGAWLTFATTAVYSAYDDGGLRLWNIDVTDDQQMAGVFMKVVSGFYLWGIIIVLFFRWAVGTFERDNKSNLLTDEQVDQIEALRAAGPPSTASTSTSS